MALTQTQISMLYVAIFNRASEGAGNTYWQDKGTMAEVATAMLDTSDAATYFGDSLDTNQAFIEHIYLNTLNKTVTDDAAGIKFWVDLLEAGTSRGEVIDGLVNAATDQVNIGDSQDLFNNRVNVSNYMAENLEDTPDDYKTSTSFSDGLKVVTNDSSTVPAGDKIIDGLAGGNNFVLTTDVDTFITTDASDTITGISSTIGSDDKIIDTSVTDHDVMNIELTADLPTLSIANIEEINVTLKTMGGTDVQADSISGATITVAADPAQIGFTGAATISELGDNGAVAGAGITALTVDGVKSGLIDTGSATTLDATLDDADQSLNLKINGDISLTATAHKDLNVETTADATLTLGGTIFSNNGIITGDSDLTIKTVTATFDTANAAKVLTNKGTGNLAIELTDSTKDVDLTKVDANEVITDIAFTKIIEFTDTLDVTAKATANTMTLTDATPAGTGGSAGTNANIHLTKAGTLATDTYTFVGVDKASIEAQEGGGIDSIVAGSANLTLNTAKDLSVTNIDAAGQGVLIDAASAGKIVLTDIDASAVVASGFTKDFTMTETTGATTQITVLGGTAKNSITLATTTAAATVVTQDDKDIIIAVNTTGDLTVNAAGGDDTVSAVKMTTSKAKIDLGAGNDTLALKNLATGDTTVNAGDGDDTINIATATAGKMVINGDAGNDTIDVDSANGALDNAANITVNGGAGNDLIKGDSTTASTEILTIDGGDGNDIFEVTSGADFVTANLTMSNLETLKIDTTAVFSDNQLNDQTFAVASGTANVDVLHVTLDGSVATDSENSTNLGSLDFSASTSTKVEYLDIDATASLSSDKIIGGHNVTNVIDITDADGTAINPVNNTIQLFADSIGNTIDNLQSAATQPDVTKAMLQDPEANIAEVSFDVAVITGFQTSKVDGDNKVISDDSLILGDAATATNYKAIAADDAFNGSAAPDIGMEEYLANALADANTQLAANSDLAYVYVYDANTTTANPISQDAWLMWDSDGNHSVDAAILLVGVEPAAPDGTGFAASDIIAG